MPNKFYQLVRIGFFKEDYDVLTKYARSYGVPRACVVRMACKEFFKKRGLIKDESNS